MPPAAPEEGTTQQSQSVEPPAAPQTGTTVRNYSYQPATVYYQPAPTRMHRLFNPEQRRQHPTSAFSW